MTRTGDTAWLVFVSAAIGAIVLLGLKFWQKASFPEINDPYSYTLCKDANGLTGPCPLDVPWPAEHVVLSGLIAFAVALVVGRMLVFMSRMESNRA
jgi:hypothetical protein